MNVIRVVAVFGLILICAACNSKKSSEPLPGVSLLNLVAVDQVLETRLIDFGAEGSRRHLAGRWSFDKKGTADKTFAVGRPGDRILFDCVVPRNRKMVVRMRARGTPRTMTATVNGQPIRDVEVKVAWENQSFEIPAKLLQAGSNAFSLQGEGGQVAVDQVSFPDALTGSGLNTFRQSPRASVEAPSESLLGIYLKVPAKALLHIRYRAEDREGWQRGSAQYTIGWQEDSGASGVLQSGTVTEGWLGGREVQGVFDLSQHAGKILRITLQSTAGAEPAPPFVEWEASLDAPPDAAPKATPVAVERPRAVILYVIDALRPDHLQPYGYAQPTSPRIAEFARESVIFQQAHAQSSWTRSAVASMLTGQYPSGHLVRTAVDALSPDLPTFATRMKDAGFQTFAFMTNANLNRNFRFDHGFDHFYTFDADKPLSDDLYKRIEAAPELQQAGGPMFLYIHAMDPHSPYVRNVGPAGSLPDCKSDQTVFRGANMHEEKECATLLYDREIYRSDFYFGKFLDLLKQRGLYDNSLIVVTADHGEAFFEHGDLGHGKTLYEEVLRVPLLLRLPAGKNAGRSVAGRVRHIDILPTVLATMGRPQDARLEGASLLNAIPDGIRQDLPVISELLLFGENKRAFVLDRYKWIANYPRDKEQQPTYEVYDLQTDPAELQNLADSSSILTGYMTSRMRHWVHSQETKAEQRKALPAEIDSETKERLRALGYIQ